MAKALSRAETPQSPCVIKNTVLHFVTFVDSEEQVDEIDILKGKVTRRRPRSEPPVRSPLSQSGALQFEEYAEDSTVTIPTTPSNAGSTRPLSGIADFNIGDEDTSSPKWGADSKSGWNSEAAAWFPTRRECYGDVYPPSSYDVAAPELPVYPVLSQGGLEGASESAEPQRRAQGAARGPREDPMPWHAGVVTVMIRQIPRRYSQMQILERLIHRGFGGAINFLYLPFDTRKGTNVGYCFVGFTEHCHALRLRNTFNGSHLDKVAHKDKSLRVHPASMQGYDASVKHFSGTKTGQSQDRRFSHLFLGADGRTPPPSFDNAREAENDTYTEHIAEQEAYGEQQWTASAPATEPAASWRMTWRRR
mmetsp:Transcript_20558/g.52461  ORF Transcript_20558/g.52461 Transcript_20558/m.52461 type:complete len:363 (+) Transcript_20558:148-1236(+)